MMLNPALKHREAWICRRSHTSGKFSIREEVCLWRFSHPVRDGSATEWQGKQNKSAEFVCCWRQIEHYRQELPEIPCYHCIYCYLVIQPAVKISAIVKFDS